ncbi:hypothetical protein [Mycoplasma sp. CSL7503-lung]|uniref:hypothetical protein n=1 Tax=Mycoplasma sp. CSL7503-lung TaxID=536372 RepID=UPI0021D09A68|nr:hypothetical protein [Mycoplasma sp. CSL7503-lung]MCU4706660.1 hypothetical protein [Mycoplasma sp. CSL7503-lung]
MKKRNKWFILGSIAISFGSLPSLIACSNNTKTRKPIPKNNSKIDEHKTSDNHKNEEKDKNNDTTVDETSNNVSTDSNIVNTPNNVETIDAINEENETRIDDTASEENSIEKDNKNEKDTKTDNLDNSDKETTQSNDPATKEVNDSNNIEKEKNSENEEEIKKEQNISPNAVEANTNVDQSNNTHSFNKNYNLTEDYITQQEINVKNISEFNINDEYFTAYRNWLSNKTNPTYTNVIFDNSKFIEYTYISSVYNRSTLTIQIKTNFDLENFDDYKLSYKQDEDEIKEINLTQLENSKRAFVATITNVPKNYKIKLVNLKKTNKEVNFSSKGDILLGNDVLKNPTGLSISNDNEWKTWVASGTRHTFKITFTNKYQRAPYVSQDLRLVWLTKDKQIQSARLTKTKKKDYQTVSNNSSNFDKLIAESDPFDVTNIDRILGLEIKDNNNWVKINGIPEIKIIGREDDNTLLNTNAPRINTATLNNNNVNVNFFNLDSSLSQEQNINFEIKSLDPFTPFSNVYAATKNNDNSYTINNVSLPKDISNFIITRVNFGEQIYNYNINNLETRIKNTPINKNFEIQKLNFYADETNKNIYGSIGINFTNEDLNLFKNKNLELTFVRKTEIHSENIETDFSIFTNLFLKKQKVVVPFDKLQKFNLNGFYENFKYELEEVKIVDKYSLQEFLDSTHFSFNSKIQNNKSFLYNFKYTNFDNNYIAGATEGETKNSLISKENSNNKTLDYSLQNHYATINYNRERWYKQKAIMYEDYFNHEILGPRKEYLNRQSEFILTKDGKTVKTHFISPREVINDLSWTINREFNKASIVKDISQYDGLENHLDDAIFEIGFEFDPKQRQVIDLIEPEPFVRYNRQSYKIDHSSKNMSKSFVYISVPYKEIIKNNEITDLGFEYLAIRNPKDEELKLKQLIQLRYKFSVKYDSNSKKLTYVIESKDPKTKIFERLGDHYFSLNNSAFLGNSLFFVHWVDFDSENQKPITYIPKNKPGVLSSGLNQLNFVDNYDYVTTTLSGSSRRVYFNDTEENVLNARNRVFNFAPGERAGGEGTWDVIGKVNPNDPNDYKFFVTTNQHVWGGAPSREFKNNKFNLPIKLFEPVGGWAMGKADPRGRVEGDRIWSEATVNVELVANFHNDYTFPNSSSFFKNNYGEINNNSTWGIFGEGRTEHSLSNADLVVGIADFKDFYQIFEEKGDKLYYNGVLFTENDENIYRTYNFFKNLKTLKTLKPSKHNLHLSRLVNLNWSIASFPINAQDINADTINNKRYREYIIGSMDDRDIIGLSYGGARSKLPAIPLNALIFDLQGGSSGSMAFDSEGNATGLLTESTFQRSNVMMIDTNGSAFLGDGKTTQNPGSFYERMRLLSYLYPDKYDSSEFNTLPNWEKLNNE